MTFASRLTRCPIPYDVQNAEEPRTRFAGLAPELVELLTGTAGCSPYLAGLMLREAEWLEKALHEAPEAVLAAELAELEGLGSDALARPAACETTDRAFDRTCRSWRGLGAGRGDHGDQWLADSAVHLSFVALVGDEIRRGKLPGMQADDAVAAAGMVALAMGKMGAGELNYSSDIDLICLFDDGRFAGDDVQEARPPSIKVVRRMTAMLSDLTSDGYVFRTDLRLRPDASVTPVCISMAAAEALQEAQGRTWERAAFIKARACAGDIAAGERFLRALTPFVWRKHLDFAAIQDAHDMRLRIRHHKGLHGPIVLEGHNLKLGQGASGRSSFSLRHDS
jgi:glutamate-ammonia-ligase adenylyltransferase